MIAAAKLGQFPRVIRTCWLPEGNGSANRVIFSLPDGGIGELYVDFEHSEFSRAASSWSNSTFGKLGETPVHADELFGLLSGCDEPEIGIEKFDALLSPHMDADYCDWRVFTADLQAEANSEWVEDRRFFIAQKGLK